MEIQEFCGSGGRELGMAVWVSLKTSLNIDLEITSFKTLWIRYGSKLDKSVLLVGTLFPISKCLNERGGSAIGSKIKTSDI